MQSVATKINFKSFATLLEKISKIDDTKNSIGKNDEKKKTLQTFMDAWRQTAKKFNDENPEYQLEDNFYPAMRLLLPGDDRRVYGLKETKLAKYLIEALCIAPKSDDAQKLVNYRTPSNVKSDGDFASVAYFVLKYRCREDITLPIHEINNHLDIISANNAKGKEGQKDVNNSIKHLLVNLSALQLKWLIRIILKDLKIGIKERVILDSFHPDAMDLYNFSSSLEKVCQILNDPNKRYHEIGVNLFTPCRPMLGEKAKPNKIEELLGGRQFYIETKFDGERFQLHKCDDKFMYYSRNSHNYTETFGSDIYDGTLTPFIYDCFSKNAKNLILDGEMCAFDVKDKILLSKSDDIDVKSSRQYENIQTCFCVFDILLYNDIVLTNKPLKERIEFLNKSFEEKEGRLIISNRQLANSNQQAVEALNNAIDSRLEGIVVKDPESVYKPSMRGGGWYKVKPDYMLGLNDDLDLLVIGGYYGTGRRSGLISHFLLGVAVDESITDKKKLSDDLGLDLDEKEGESEQNNHIFYPKFFFSFCKIGSGYSIKELHDFNQKLENKWVKFDKKNMPKNLEFAYEKPDVWIEPKDSFIVQVKAVEICLSDKYKTGCTLRFPRLEKFRQDKNWHECMKLSELKSLREKNDGKLTSGKHFDLNDYNEEGNFNFDDEDGEPFKKKKKTINRASRKAAVGSIYRGIDASVVEKIGDTFTEKEICIIIEDDNQKKMSLEKSLAELGGIPVQNPSKETFCIVTSKLTHKIKSYIKNDLYDIVKVDWLIKCIKDANLYKWKPKDMIHSKLETKNKFRILYDSYGDSYLEDSTIASLKEIFSNECFVNEEYKPKIDDYFKMNLRNKIAYLENKHFPDNSAKFGLFRMQTFYIDLYDKIGDMTNKCKSNSCLDLIELKIRWRGGLVMHKVCDNTTHCILNKKNLYRLDELKQLNKKRDRKFRIVSFDWINDCIKFNRIKDELAYVL